MTGAPLMAEMTWPEIAEAGRAGAVALWSVGSTEQHGPHLPVSVDHLLPVELSLRIAERVHVVIPPPQPFGNRSHPLSGGGQGFPGTTSLRAPTLITVVRDVVGELARTFDRIAIVNWHAENANLLYEGVELARFGLLHLRGGEGLVAPEWLALQREPTPARPAYGLMWWLGDGAFYASGTGERPGGRAPSRCGRSARRSSTDRTCR